MLGAVCAIVILGSPGGLVAATAAEVRAANEADCSVSILGDCRSACTLWLAAEDLCVAADARFTFHGPRSRNEVPLTPERFDHWSTFMARHYPEPLGDWFMAEGRFGEFRVTGQVIINLGVTECL